jgi:uncharacterized protein YggE
MLLPSVSIGQQPAPEGVPQIVTTGHGEIRVVPDRATIVVGVQARAATAAAAATQNAQAIKTVIDAERALGIPANQIATTNYSVTPEVRYDKDSQAPRTVSYLVTNSVRVSVMRVDQVGPVIDAALSKGANQVSSIEFSSSSSEQLRRDAVVMAVENAKADAEAMAQAAGGSLGPVIEITNNDMGIRPMFRQAFDAVSAVRGAAATPIEAGEEAISATVTVRWRFQPAPSR